MPFQYFRDPLFRCCVAIYLFNRWVLKPAFDWTFLHGYLNDVICLPIWGTVVVAITARLGVRDRTAPPQGWELVVMLLIWSAMFEVWAPTHPYLSKYTIGDPWDMLAYAAGGFASLMFWDRYYRLKH